LRALDWGWTQAETGDEANIAYDDDGVVDSIIVKVTDNTRTETPQARTFLQDVFARLVATATGLFGPPTNRVPDEYPRVDWRDEKVTLSITRLSVVVTVTIMPNEHRDFWDEAEGDLE
jgi:hypothetical protein